MNYKYSNKEINCDVMANSYLLIKFLQTIQIISIIIREIYIMRLFKIIETFLISNYM